MKLAPDTELPGGLRAPMTTPEEQMPLCRYRGALLMLSKLRKVTKCTLCWEPLAVGDEVWRPVDENIRRGVLRSQRYHRAHFLGGMYYEDDD